MKSLLLVLPLAVLALPALAQDATVPAPDLCHAADHQALVGQNMAAAMKAGLFPGPDLRIFRSGAMLTMDMRPDRLNVEFDGTDKIIRVYCG